MRVITGQSVRGLILLAALAGFTSAGRGDQPPSFHGDVIPILTRFGCNAGACHGKLAGQNGFRLSLRGYAPNQDYEALVRESFGRRVFPAAPEQSLLIAKAVGQVPHGGGRRFDLDSPAARTLVAWIRAGMPAPRDDEPELVRLEVQPGQKTLTEGERLSLRATAVDAAGGRRDVTWLTQFAAGDSAMLDVDPSGQVVARRAGESVVRAAYRGLVEVAEITVPFQADVDPADYAARHNAIDGPVFDKLRALGIRPSPLCDDATFLRRASLDATGRLPDPRQVRQFLNDPRPDKRQRLVDQLLERPEFVDYWTHWLADLLQNRRERDHDVRGTKGVRQFHAWLREQVAANRSWREIATDVLTASGSCAEQPAVGYFIVTVGEKEAEQSEVADSVAQAFLGTRIGCARCHNHPLEKYTQDDYYRFVGFFSRVALDRRKPEEGSTELIVGTRHLLNLRKQLQQETGKLEELRSRNADPKELEASGNRLADLRRRLDEAAQAPVAVRQPRTGEMLAPRPLDRSEVPVPPGSDPRQALVQWLAGDGEPLFSGAMVNRLWKHFLGTGLVEPEDDLRATNPPSNRPLWDLLNQEFRASNYDLKHLMRRIMNSRTYQLAAETTPANSRDYRFYSHFQARRLPAEVLLDAIGSATGRAESFAGYPQGMRAVQIPDPFVESRFLTMFGRADRTTACACERTNDVTLPQLLHLQNSDELSEKLRASDGRLASLLRDVSDNRLLIEEIYLATLSRLPNEEERRAVEAYFQDADRQEVARDLFWALLNSSEFAFNH